MPIPGGAHTCRRLALAWLLVPLLASVVLPLPQARVSNDDRRLYKQMLEDIRDDIQKNDYDPALRGIDLKARIQAAQERVAGGGRETEWPAAGGRQ